MMKKQDRMLDERDFLLYCYIWRDITKLAVEHQVIKVTFFSFLLFFWRFLATLLHFNVLAQVHALSACFPSCTPHGRFFSLYFRFWGTCADHAGLLHRYIHGKVVCCLHPPHHLYLVFIPLLSLPNLPIPAVPPLATHYYHSV